MHNSLKRPIHAQGFTLIELLVVIGIIGIIAAILFPVFASVRERGRRTACLFNERQIGIAMLQYVTDNNETFPSGKISECDNWVTQVYPYLKDTAIFHCPDDATTYPVGRGGLVTSYGLNSNLGITDAAPGIPVTGRMMMDLNAPTATVLLFEVENGAATLTVAPHLIDGSVTGDAGEDGAAPSQGGSTLTDFTYPIGSNLGFALYATGNIGGRLLNGATKNGKALGGAGSVPRHKDGADYLACDGHAVWLRPDSVSGGQEAAASNCLQGTQRPQPNGCTTQWEGSAAGTMNGGHVLTFSTR